MRPEDPAQLSLSLGTCPQEDAPEATVAAAAHGPVAAAGLADLVIGSGPRATERVLLDRLEAHARACRSDPGRLARSVRVIVPSRSLRDHLATVVLQRTRRPLLGVVLQTHFAAALEILERAGETTRDGRLLLGLLVRRFAREEPALAAPLRDLDDGYGIVTASVDDLLDAGLAPHLEDPVREALIACRDDGLFVDRASAVVRIALRVGDELARRGFDHGSQLLLRAADRVRAAPHLLPSQEVWIHGFAEATGVVTDLLEAIFRTQPASLLIDEPLEPGRDDAVDPGAVFTRRLRERFEGMAAVRRVDADPLARPAGAELVSAPGHEAEARAVAGRIRALLDGGAPPERIAVVARQLGPHSHALAMRVHFGRLGIPFSGVGSSVRAGAEARMAGALEELLRRGEECASDRWVGALRALPGAEGGRLSLARRADLQLALRHLGAARLSQVAALDLDALEIGERGLELPVRRGLAAGQAEDAGDPDDLLDSLDDERDDAITARAPFARRRYLPRPALSAAVECATALCRQLARWPARASIGEHLGHLRRILTGELGWSSERWRATGLGELEAGLPASFPLERDELIRLVLDRLALLAGSAPIGGQGGGVAVLDVTEARARTFEHLFVVGLNRDVFPRPVREDPLIPDALRRRMLAVLPDLPIKGTSHDEERYLFAQLYAASPNPTLCWESASDDGKERVSSTLVDRLRGRRGIVESSAPGLHEASLASAPGGCSAREHAILAGVAGSAAAHAALAPLALCERVAPREAGRARVGVQALSAARLAVMCELGLRPVADAPLGPYFGFLGPVTRAEDLRSADRYVTTLEQMARCPWRTALEKLLRLEAAPDPLESLPEIDARLIGNVVHAALEALFAREPGARPRPRLEQAAASAEPRPWPDDERLRTVASQRSREALGERAPRMDGLAEVLTESVLACLRRARELDSLAAEPVQVLDAEVEGELRVGDGAGAHRLLFKADRLERLRDGSLVITDFKTGRRPLSDKKKPEVRRAHFRAGVLQGRLLQAVAYARASGGAGDRGRYVFVRPGIADDLACSVFAASDPDAEEIRKGFEQAVRTLGRAWDRGVFAPRLTEVDRDEEPSTCAFCDVSDACIRGDSGLRRRQRYWIEQAHSRDPRDDDDDEGIYHALWMLARKPQDPGPRDRDGRGAPAGPDAPPAREAGRRKSRAAKPGGRSKGRRR